VSSSTSPRRGPWGRILAADPEPIGDDTWVIRASLPRHGINVFLVREDDGVVCFDTGSRELAGELRRLAAGHGGISRVVLSHAHYDHRGCARRLGAPVYCHPAERAFAERRTYDAILPGASTLKILRVHLMGALRDAGPVSIAGTVQEGDRVGSYTVVELPGHTPGQIGLWREADRTVLAADCFYTLNEHTAGYPYSIYGQDDQQAAASVRRIIDLEPAVAWPGHGPALRGDVRGPLQRALATKGH